MKIKYNRQFLGKLTGFSSPEEKNYEQRHLKAYIKGQQLFNYGFEGVGRNRRPKYHLVKQTLEVVE